MTIGHRGARRAPSHPPSRPRNLRSRYTRYQYVPIGGVELLAEIKERSPSTQVVMVTACPTDDTRDECTKLGAAGYLTNPLIFQN